MQNRSNRGSGKPVWVRAHQARACVWDPIQRIALGPAVMKTASTGRTHDCTRPICINIKKTTLAKGEPSTHDPKRKFDAPSARRILGGIFDSGWGIVANGSPYFAPFKEDVRGQSGVGNQTLLPQLRGQVLRPEKETAGVPEMRDRGGTRAADTAFPAALRLNWRQGSSDPIPPVWKPVRHRDDRRIRNWLAACILRQVFSLSCCKDGPRGG